MPAKTPCVRDELTAALKAVRGALAELESEEGGTEYVRDLMRPLWKIRDRLPRGRTAAAITLAALLSSGCADLKAIAEGFAGPCHSVSEEALHPVAEVGDVTGRPIAKAWRAKDGTVCAETY